MNAISPQIQRSWTHVSDLFKIRNEQDYDVAVEHLNTLLDEVGTDERHPLYSLLDTLGTVLHAWEEQHHAMPECGGSGCAAILHGGAQFDPVGLAGDRVPRGCFGDSERQTGPECQADPRFVKALRGLTFGLRVGSTNGNVQGRGARSVSGMGALNRVRRVSNWLSYTFCLVRFLLN